MRIIGTKSKSGHSDLSILEANGFDPTSAERHSGDILRNPFDQTNGMKLVHHGVTAAVVSEDDNGGQTGACPRGSQSNFRFVQLGEPAGNGVLPIPILQLDGLLPTPIGSVLQFVDQGILGLGHRDRKHQCQKDSS